MSVLERAILILAVRCARGVLVPRYLYIVYFEASLVEASLGLLSGTLGGILGSLGTLAMV